MSESPENTLIIAESLKSLGLTKYEALVYIALLKVSGATATEIHEISGVPRASVYPVLDRLLQKNLVAVSHTTPKRFASIPPDEGIENLLKSIESDAEGAKEVLNTIFHDRNRQHKGEQELIWSIYGTENIRTRILDLVRNAQSSVRIIIYWGLVKEEIEELITEISSRVPVEIITDYWEGDTPANIRFYLHVPPEGYQCGNKCSAGGVFLIDNLKVLVLMGSEEEGTTALYSESKGFLRFFNLYWNLFASWAGSKLHNPD
jgi:sugar-specific transcriptional regulator TrmB